MQTSKQRQIGGVYAIADDLGTKNTVKTDVVDSAPAQNNFFLNEILSLC